MGRLLRLAQNHGQARFAAAGQQYGRRRSGLCRAAELVAALGGQAAKRRIKSAPCMAIARRDPDNDRQAQAAMLENQLLGDPDLERNPFDRQQLAGVGLVQTARPGPSTTGESPFVSAVSYSVSTVRQHASLEPLSGCLTAATPVWPCRKPSRRPLSRSFSPAPTACMRLDSVQMASAATLRKFCPSFLPISRCPQKPPLQFSTAQTS